MNINLRRSVLTFLLGLIPVSAGAEDWSQITAAAKREAKLVFYSAHVGNPVLKAIVNGFSSSTGIPVELLEARANELRERTRIEYASNRTAADVTFTSEGQAALIDAEDKVFGRHDPLPEASHLRAPLKDDGLFAPVMMLTYGILVNATQVPESIAPKRWADLTDPKWKGRILADDVRTIGGGYSMLFTTLNTPSLGLPFNEALARQELTFTRDQREAGRRVARGEFPIYTPFILSDVANLKGLPVKALVMEEGAPYVLYGTVLMKSPPHPNAARLFMNYMMSEEAQALWAKAGHGFAREGLDERVPAEMRDFVHPKLLGTTDINRQNEGLALAKKLYP